MAMTAQPLGPDSTSYKTTYQTVQLTLPQAIEKVLKNELRPNEVFYQLPGKFREHVNSYCKETLGSDFINLDLVKQKKVMAEILDLIKEQVKSQSTIKSKTSSDKEKTTNRRLSIFKRFICALRQICRM